VRKDTRLSPLFCTASDGNLGGAWERGYTAGHCGANMSKAARSNDNCMD